MSHSVIISTASTRDEAQQIARSLVEKKVAACVNVVGPIDSIYRWKGEVETAQEFLLLIKTEADRFESVRNAIEALHTYETPELIQIAIENGSPEYLNWISESVK
jgi:periplasmic divalent cation tolerance protein